MEQEGWHSPIFEFLHPDSNLKSRAMKHLVYIYIYIHKAYRTINCMFSKHPTDSYLSSVDDGCCMSIFQACAFLYEASMLMRTLVLGLSAMMMMMMILQAQRNGVSNLRLRVQSPAP